MRIFVNNVDGYLAGAICADLTKISKNLVGTRKTIRDELVPPMVKRIVPRVDVRRFLKAVTSCNVVIYDLHDADFEELELVIRMLQMSEISHDLTFIVISSIGVWSRTARSYEELAEPAVPSDQPPPEEGSGGTATAPSPPAVGTDGEADADDAEGGAEETPEEQPPPPPMRPVALTSQDYVKRLPAPKFQEWKDIETQVLALKDKPGGTIRPYVVCAGVPYGNGEDAFLGLFKSAWQSRPTLRVIGEGKNYIPMVHARDVARLTRHLLEASPSLDYHVAVDRGDVTQKTLIQAVAKQFALPYDPAPVTVAEAILAELADILTINLRFEPSYLMEVPWEPPAPEEVEEESKEEKKPEEAKAPEVREPSHASAALQPPDSAKTTRPNSQVAAPTPTGGAEIEKISEEPGPPIYLPPPGFRWWSEAGIVENMQQVASEFCLWRQLVPVKLALVGPSGNGSGELCHRLAEMYNVPAFVLDELIQDFATRESPLGLQIKEQRDMIAANAANPKSQGPFSMPGQLVAKVMSTAMAEKPGTHRGWIMSGFPRTLEESLAFYTDAPPTPAEPPKKGKEVEAVNLEELKFKDDFKPDIMVLVNSAKEVCQTRLESQGTGDFIEKEFQTGMDQWNKDIQQIQEIFTKHLAAAEVTVSSDQAAEAEREKHEAEVKSAEEEEREAPAAPDEKDLVVLASSTWTWVDTASSSVSQALQDLHPVCNFLPPPNDPLASQQASKAESGEATQEVLAQAGSAEAPNEEKLRQEQRVENVKKEELAIEARLEKHSEPLRLYLMKFVVPALTGALVELCHEQPEDPVGYLAEYLSLYSEASRERESSGGRYN